MSTKTIGYASIALMTCITSIASAEPARMRPVIDAELPPPECLVVQAETSSTASARPPQAWVDERVGDARERLSRSTAGQLVWSAIEAHGGLERWYRNGPLSFRYIYRPLGDRPVRDTRQIIDTWSSRARHQLSSDERVEFGWDGHRAWVHLPAGVESPVSNVRFWSLTPYYFVAMPFVLADPGVVLTDDGDAEYEGRSYDLVRATFEPGIGDAPDDFYVVYIDQQTHTVGALRYVVSYPGFFPDGGHSPEKLMTYEEPIEVDGIRLAQHSRFYAWVGDAPQEQVTDATIGDIEFVPDLSSTTFDPPPNANILEGL